MLDLQENFPKGGFGSSDMGPPPPEVIEDDGGPKCDREVKVG